MKRFVLNVAGLFVAIVAVLFALPSLYLMAAILWLIPAASYLMGLLMLGGLECERALPLSATAGEALELTYTLRNTGRLPKFYLLVRDSLPRGVSLPEGPPPLVLGLWPGEERAARCLAEARRRGVFLFGPAQVYSTDPLGLQTFAQKVPGTSELTVYPAVLELRGSWLHGAAAGYSGADGALARGDGDDFYGVREYGTGDELRRVHWRTTARTGTLAVAEYTRGVTLEVTVALDLFRPAYAGTGDDEDGALECAVTLAATLLADLLRRGHAVRLLTAAMPGELRTEAAGASAAARSPEDLPRLLERLARVQADAAEPLASVLAEDIEGGGHPSLLAVVTPDSQDAALTGALRDWERRGGRSFLFALDAGSFRTGQPGLPALFDGPNARAVRRGDDLRRLLEGDNDGWAG